MPFESVLYERPGDWTVLEQREQPEFFRDLHLDQIVAAVTGGSFKAYDLAPFFHLPLPNADAVAYRQEIMRDLQNPDCLDAARRFARAMYRLRELVTASQKLPNEHAQRAWHLAAVRHYGRAVQRLQGDLTALPLRSRGLTGLLQWLGEATAADDYTRMLTRADDVQRQLDEVRYSIVIDGDRVTVRTYGGEEDYTVLVQQTFAKFRVGAVKDYRLEFKDSIALNHIEEEIVNRVALLFPQPFAALREFRETYPRFQHDILKRFDREVNFYIAWLDWIAPLRRAGLPFCQPLVSTDDKAIACDDGFDLALAAKQGQASDAVIRNGFELRGCERVLVVTGANQGGKTTFARMFGQLHWLAALGLHVPATAAKLFLFDRMFTHFEREESVATLRGKLHDDLVRMHEILLKATDRSLIVMNEIFSSTSLKDAQFLARRVLEAVCERDTLALCVTFMVELARLNEKTVSYVATVDPHDPAIRTFQIERRPADGQAHAMALARKHGLTREQLAQRLAG